MFKDEFKRQGIKMLKENCQIQTSELISVFSKLDSLKQMEVYLSNHYYIIRDYKS